MNPMVKKATEMKMTMMMMMMMMAMKVIEIDVTDNYIHLIALHLETSFQAN